MEEASSLEELRKLDASDEFCFTQKLRPRRAEKYIPNIDIFHLIQSMDSLKAYQDSKLRNRSHFYIDFNWNTV